ncbi:MAG TPA: GMC family oxidoreductase [Steroidobacteraceae bacterium]|nr:GMC family oxidoreductase [Steroidobacteraceae bacterium]
MNTPDPNRLYDAVIVGSGAGGAAAAHTLVRAGLDVLLLEKGRELPTDGSTLDFRAVVHEGRFKSREAWRDGRNRELVPEEYFNVGGKTRWFGAALLRYSESEFDADDSHQCRAWPIQYRDMLPWYQQAEQQLGVRRFACEPALARIVARLSARRSGWQDLPLPLGLDEHIVEHDLEARHFDGFASVAGHKGDANRAFLSPIAGHGNFTLATGEEVTGLMSSPGRPTHVVGVRTASGITFTAREVLLAAGALHTPRLVARHLLEHGLERTLPAARHVGRNLKLHLLTAMLAFGVERPSDVLRKTTYFTHPDLPHSSVQPLGFDGELLGTLIPRIVPRAVARRLGAHAYGFFLQTEDGSHPDNRVLDGGRGANPVIDYDDARVGPARLEHRRLVSRLQRSLAGTGLIAFSQRIGLAGTAHACGTMIAGHDPAESAVDGWGRIHGMRGVRVVDGSVLPRSSRVNPSLSIFGWSLRSATQLAQALREDTSAFDAVTDAVASGTMAHA